MNSDGPGRMRMVSQNAGMFCLSEYKRPMDSKNASVKSEGDNHESRSDRRYRSHWIKAGQQAARARARSIAGSTQHRRQYPYGRRAGRSPDRRLGSRGRIKLSFVGGRSSAEVLRNLNS